MNPNNQLSVETVKSTDEIPVGSEGLIARINYAKDNHLYAYDTNICESAFQTTIYDNDKIVQGLARLDTNGFINSRPSVNEVLITNALYFTDKSGTTIKEFSPGNVYATLNASPDLTFKFTIPCSSNFPQATIPEVTTSTDSSLLFLGLDSKFLQNCGDKLYLSFQNSNLYNDIQIVGPPITLTQVTDNTAGYDLRLADLAGINSINSVFPFTYTVKLHLRDRSDSRDVQTLGTGILNIPKYTKTAGTSSSTTQSTTTTSTNISTEDASATENRTAPSITDLFSTQDTTTLATPPITFSPNIPGIIDLPSLPITDTSTETTSATPSLIQEDSTTTTDPAPAPFKIRHMPEKILVLPKIVQ